MRRGGEGIMALGLQMILNGWKQDQGKLVDMRQRILKPDFVAFAALLFDDRQATQGSF